MDYQKIIDEYPQEYCSLLELCYGEGMMSEGGSEAIDQLFSGVDLYNKKVLEIGFGQGGLAQYISNKYPSIDYHGVEINADMVKHANKHYKKPNTHFYHLENPDVLPFPKLSFDLIFSKGVLVHLDNKLPLFTEIHRVCKKDALFIVNDWLSPDGAGFGELVDKMCELEGLTLYPTTMTQYVEVLTAAGFLVESMTSENKAYAQYNADVVTRLQQQAIKQQFLATHSEEEYQECIDAYGWISQAFAQESLLLRRFVSRKTKP
ncbi:class I SAM-dependent methyltransferase [Cysteiniphilum sp. QT6929]|uniref:class I SAM-dependent methyltransferase n=1 Tax=Cysteiniphilum sp. QT6929 TaxID=2975055 RepID=UPI0024B3A15F|nr:class I SAM-dependent methyltransferase [Cysteiniphilum sp. QT6929]WHN64891.1 methyltransferase domain-containing protein [Cysteiniphilum sp. QT6929]